MGSKFKNIKEVWKRLKGNGIYDYNKIRNYNKILTCLIFKKEAIDFLYPKISEEILILKGKIQSTDRMINMKDIIETENRVFHLKNEKFRR